MSSDELELSERISAVPSVETFAAPDLPPFGQNQLEFDLSEAPLSERDGVEVRQAVVKEHKIKTALKQVSQRQTAGSHVRESVATEAEHTVSIDHHPHVVTVLDWSRQPWPWYAMEFLDGGSLAEHGDSMDVAYRLWTAYVLADAVSYAHGRGIGHYDITPENVRFSTTPAGVWDAPKLIDWAGSRNLRRQSRQTVTPAYASPEMRSPTDRDRVGFESDVYQLGVVIYEMLTGQLPNREDGGITQPSQLVNVPQVIDGPILKALVRNPRNRTYLRPFRDTLRESLLTVVGENSERDNGVAREREWKGWPKGDTDTTRAVKTENRLTESQTDAVTGHNLSEGKDVDSSVASTSKNSGSSAPINNHGEKVSESTKSQPASAQESNVDLVLVVGLCCVLGGVAGGPIIIDSALDAGDLGLNPSTFQIFIFLVSIFLVLFGTFLLLRRILSITD